MSSHVPWPGVTGSAQMTLLFTASTTIIRWPPRQDRSTHV